MLNRATAAATLAAVCGAGVAMGQTGFQPATELVAVEPPPGVMPMNAGQVILGLAQRYVLALPPDQTHSGDRVAVTTDFQTITELTGLNAPTFTRGVGVSEDGRRVLAQVRFSNPSRYRACVWLDETPTLLNSTGQPVQQTIAISTDGLRVLIASALGPAEQADIVENGVATRVVADINEDPPLGTHALAMSPDGQWVTGIYNLAPSMFAWSKADGGRVFSTPTAAELIPAMISNGGARMVFRSNGENIGGEMTLARGQWRLMNSFQSTCMTTDGSMVLGSSSFTGGAALWTETTGVESVRTALEARGINVRGWSLQSVEYVSADGRRMVGRGRAPGSSVLRWWAATVEPFAAADMGKAGGLGGSDGKLDNNDFIVFINRFFAQDERVDVGKAGGERGGDGVFDNNDFCAFIGMYFGGEP